MQRNDDASRDRAVPVDQSAGTYETGLFRRFRLGLGARGTQWMVAGAGLAAFGAYLFQLIGTRALGGVRYAPIGTLWTIQYLLVSVALLPLETHVARESLRASDQEGRRAVSLRRLWLWVCGLALAASGVCWLLRDELFHGFDDLAVVVGLIVVTYAAFLIVRGRLAGAERFKAYGVVTATESMTRAGIAGVAAAFSAGVRAFAWIMPVGAALAAVWWLRVRAPVTEANASPSIAGDRKGSGTFFASTTAANAIMQLLLAGGPLLLAFLDASPAEISVFFVTVTAVRVPLVFAFGGVLSRLLPTFMRLGRGAAGREPGVVAAKIAIGTLAAAALLGTVAVGVGGPLVALFFGQSFEPPWWLAAGATVGVVLATGSIVLNQLLIARGLEVLGLVAWVAAFSMAALAVVVTHGSASARAVAALLTGEVVALAGLVIVAATAQVAAVGFDGTG